MLSLLLVVGLWQGTGARNKALSPIDLTLQSEPLQSQPEIVMHPVARLESGRSACGMSRPGTLCRDEALIYCYSIRLRERN